MSTERESIARYLEHIAQQDIGTLIDGLTPREVAQFAASWVRNELDVKWAAEVLGRAKDPFTDAEELRLLRELRVAASAMFEADVTQDGKQFHFDWKRTDKMRSALLHAQLLQLAAPSGSVDR